MKKVMELMANAGEDDCAPSISIDLKKMFSDFWEQPMEDYSSIKKEFNQLMLDLEPSLEETIRNSDDPLKTALLYARIGNYIDFAALANVDSATVLSLLNEENKDPLDENEYRRFREELASASRLVYLTDNCGEVVLDKLVVKLLKEFYPELAITVIVRGFPAINDATMEDAEEIGLQRLPESSAMAMMSAAPGFHISARKHGNCLKQQISSSPRARATMKHCMNAVSIFIIFFCVNVNGSSVSSMHIHWKVCS